MPAARLGWLTARWALPALVVLLTVVAFLPTLQNGFVNWDDGENFVNNPHYRGLGWAQLRWMFTTSLLGHYVPLTWLTLGLDYLLWEMRPGGYHLTSLLLHAATALVFYFLTLRLFECARPGTPQTPMRCAAGFAALLFALHPLRVESVAWVTERRDVLSGLFFLLAILAYLRACAAEGEDRTRRGWLAASVTAFALALLSKAIVVALPLILLALDAYPLRRLRPAARGVWTEKLPFVLLALVGAIIALVALHRTAPLRPLAEHGVAARLAQAGFGLAFYLWKSLVPVGLSPLYPLELPLNPLAPFVLSGVGVLLITGGVLAARRRFPALTVAWVCYGVLLAPVLGITHYGAQITADRYSYLACLGWAVLAGAGLLAAWRAWEGGRLSRPLATLMLSLALLIVGGLGALTWQQVGVWHDSIRLWSHVLRVTPDDNHVAHNNLGLALTGRGRLAEAIDHYSQALRIKPDYALAHYNLGVAQAGEGRLAEAIDHYSQALRIRPDYAAAYNNLGNARAEQGRLAEAIDHYSQALRIKPDYAAAHYNLGVVLAEQGRNAEATHHFRQALSRLTDVEIADIHNNLGGARARQGKLAEAVAAYQQALRLKPDDPHAHFGLGLAYLKLNQREAALTHYRALGEIDREMADRLLSQINR